MREITADALINYFVPLVRVKPKVPKVVFVKSDKKVTMHVPPDNHLKKLAQQVGIVA